MHGRRVGGLDGAGLSAPGADDSSAGTGPGALPSPPSLPSPFSALGAAARPCQPIPSMACHPQPKNHAHTPKASQADEHMLFCPPPPPTPPVPSFFPFFSSWGQGGLCTDNQKDGTPGMWERAMRTEAADEPFTSASFRATCAAAALRRASVRHPTRSFSRWA